MKPSTKRILSILGSMVFVIFSMILFGYFMVPSYGDVNKLRGELAANQKTLSEYQGIKEKVDNLYKKYDQFADIKDKIDNILPADQSLSRIVNQLNGISSGKLGIEVLSVTKLPLKQGSKEDLLAVSLGTLQVNIRLTGKYENFKSFVQGLETNLNLFDIVNFKADQVVSGSRTASSQDDLSYNMVVNTYYQSN